MFVLSLPIHDKIGDTCDCTINGAPKRVTWHDAHTLVIEPDDVRQIYRTTEDGDLRTFWCSSKGSGRASFHGPGSVIVEED
jgi:hypothetical protein